LSAGALPHTPLESLQRSLRLSSSVFGAYFEGGGERTRKEGRRGEGRVEKSREGKKGGEGRGKAGMSEGRGQGRPPS